MPPLDIHQVTQQSLFSSYYHTWYYDHLHHMIILPSGSGSVLRRSFVMTAYLVQICANIQQKSYILITCGIITILKEPMNHPTSLLLEKHRRNSPVSSRYYLTLLFIIINGIITIILQN